MHIKVVINFIQLQLESIKTVFMELGSSQFWIQLSLSWFHVSFNYSYHNFDGGLAKSHFRSVWRQSMVFTVYAYFSFILSKHADLSKPGSTYMRQWTARWAIAQ